VEEEGYIVFLFVNVLRFVLSLFLFLRVGSTSDVMRTTTYYASLIGYVAYLLLFLEQLSRLLFLLLLPPFPQLRSF
jgi:hypothetical protein